MQISTDFEGGNIEIVSIDNDSVNLKPQMRDSQDGWFYWAFCVKGAANQIVTFNFPQHRIGYYGPAISYDLENWRWMSTEKPEILNSFTYHFSDEEDLVYFAHNFFYMPNRYKAFAEKHGIPIKSLTVTEKGRDVFFSEFGLGDKWIILTSRHHACEATGTYVLEGVVEELYKNPLPGYKVAVVPFIDMDGVVDGDQGKGRYPHDHNRDYIEKPIYSSVRAVKKFIVDKNITFAFDFHSPWHQGGRNDTTFIVRTSVERLPQQRKFGKILENSITENAFLYHTKDDLDPNVEWNQRANMLSSFSGYFSTLKSIDFAFTVENPYFGMKPNIISQSNMVELGRCFAKAIRKYVNVASV